MYDHNSIYKLYESIQIIFNKSIYKCSTIILILFNVKQLSIKSIFNDTVSYVRISVEFAANSDVIWWQFSGLNLWTGTIETIDPESIRNLWLVCRSLSCSQNSLCMLLGSLLSPTALTDDSCFSFPVPCWKNYTEVCSAWRFVETCCDSNKRFVVVALLFPLGSFVSYCLDDSFSVAEFL